MTDSSTNMAVFGLLMALWTAAAVIIIWVGLSQRRKARMELRNTARLTRLLETSTALPLVVRGDGKIEASARLVRSLGVEKVPNMLDGLGPRGGGIIAEDFDALKEHITMCQRNAQRFRLVIRLKNSERRLMIVGNIADSQIYPNGAALLWVSDLTETISEWEEARNAAQEARHAFTSLSSLIEEAPFPMWYRGEDLSLKLVNKAYVTAIEGESADNVIAEQTELIEDVGSATATSIAAKAIESNMRQERIVQGTIGGQRRHLQIIDVPLPSGGVAGLAIDVQELEDTRDQYNRLAKAQRDLLDMMSVAVAQFSLDRQLVFANSPFKRLFAMREQWIEEQPEFARLLDRMRENDKLPEVRDFPEWRAQRENWFFSTTNNEENWHLPDGTHLRVLAQPLPQGGLLVIFEDRTEQVQLASAHDTLLRVRTATFDNLYEAIAVFGSDGKIALWNRKFAALWPLEDERLLQHPRIDELLGDFAKPLKKKAEIASVGEMLRDTLANRERRNLRLSFADKRHFEAGAIPLPDGNILFTMLDMSDSIRIEQALRERNAALSEADDVKNRFLANMSYELRTPLTSISGFAELLSAGVGGELPPQAQEYMQAISDSAQRLSSQINTLLDHSQAEAGMLPVGQSDVAISDIFDMLKQSYGEAAQNRDIEIMFADQSGGTLICADRDRMLQALGHLLDNAIRHGRTGGQVAVFAERQGNMVDFIISDNGPGIAKARAENATANGEAQKGAGLGLPLAEGLIEAQGGSIHIESEQGRGTIICVSIPCTG